MSSAYYVAQQVNKARQAQAVRNAQHAQAQRQTQSRFDRSRLPNPVEYYAAQGIALKGQGQWRNALCPFHEDSKPSLRVRIENGAFCCMACGAKGGDVLAFHIKRHGLSFKAAAIALGAWKGGSR